MPLPLAFPATKAFHSASFGSLCAKLMSPLASVKYPSSDTWLNTTTFRMLAPSLRYGRFSWMNRGLRWMSTCTRLVSPMQVKLWISPALMTRMSPAAASNWTPSTV